MLGAWWGLTTVPTGWALLPVIGVAVGVVLLWRLPGLATPLVGARPAVAVLVPIRNEELRISRTVAAIRGQLRAGDELVVVDDASDDLGAIYAAHEGARVLDAPPLPEGWAGKCWALWHGVHHTEAPVLVFCDADTVLADGALDRLVAAAVAGDGLVSVQPWHALGTRPTERLALLPNVVALMASGACTPFGHRAAALMAFGPVLACRRSTYLAVGGHADASVRARVVEDLFLARRFAAHGRPVQVAAGAGLASAWMYPGGGRELFEGIARSLRGGVRAAPWWATAGVVAWVWALAGGPLAWPGWYLAGVAQLWWAGRRVGRYGLGAAVAYPVLLVGFVAMMLRALTGRSARWRGRAVTTG